MTCGAAVILSLPMDDVRCGCGGCGVGGVWLCCPVPILSLSGMTRGGEAPGDPSRASQWVTCGVDVGGVCADTVITRAGQALAGEGAPQNSTRQRPSMKPNQKPQETRENPARREPLPRERPPPAARRGTSIGGTGASP